MTKPPCAIIVDATSTGRYFPAEFRRLGLDVIHVTNCQDLNPEDLAAFSHEPFTSVYKYVHQTDALASLVSIDWDPVAVIAGSDIGVTLADELASRFGLLGNNPATSARRVHKHEMIKAVSKQALTARQCLTSDLDAALQWSSAQKKWPIVTKPVASTGSEDVVYCNNAEDVARMFNRIVGKRTLFGSINSEVLLQTYLDGPQYVVNAVSREGVHHTTDVWKICQHLADGGVHITDHKWSLRPEDPLIPKLVSYTHKVLNACELMNGPSHTELRLTADGPALIETSARLMGATLDPEPFIRAFGVSQARLAAENCIDALPFEIACRRGYHVQENIAIFHLNVPHTCIFNSLVDAAEIRRLASFHAISNLPKTGSRIIRTSVNIARAGYIYLMHPDLDQLLADIDYVDQLNRSGALFDLLPLD